MTANPPTTAQLAAAHLAVWLALPDAARARVVGGLVATAVYRLRCIESPPIGGSDARDPELLAEAEADIAAALALGWVDNGTVARLAEARAGRRPWTRAKR